MIKELISEIGVFLVKKGSCTTFDTVKTWKIWEKDLENLKNMIDD